MSQFAKKSHKYSWAKRFVIAVVIAFFLVRALLAPAPAPIYLPSPYAIGVPDKSWTFSEYIDDSRQRLLALVQEYYLESDPQHFGDKYTLDRVVDMRSPFEVFGSASDCEASSSNKRIGFLLLHGLTDSPYYLREIASGLSTRFPCSLSRAILFPGHGTVPGDTLSVEWQDWELAAKFGIESLRSEVDELYIVGFSMGSTVALLYADQHREDELLKGLLLLSPAVRAKNELAYLSPYAKWFQKWLGQEEERDAARYESFSTNAGAEFYLLARQTEAKDFEPLDLPVFMAGTIDDETVNFEASISFFCERTTSDKRHMIVYQAQSNVVHNSCDGMEIVQANMPENRVVSISHTGVTNSAADAHYGFDADFSNCLHYGRGTQLYDRCMNDDSATVYAERNLMADEAYADKLIRRGSFNPHLEPLMNEMSDFIRGL
ncbi:MAG: alpha/beta fold hydrolase [Pseudohongiellaceae bacterium]|nr:alpha/beta fold hydrolase [Pseudohongiellaceae bacterium]